jgi:hypothetical protein
LPNRQFVLRCGPTYFFAGAAAGVSSSSPVSSTSIAEPGTMS